jgi:glycosyltransferase involved in cell wall biosynthesis
MPYLTAQPAPLCCGTNDRNERIRVVHVINSFEFGGAEAMLCNLLVRCDRARFDPFVVALIDDMTTAAPIIDAKIPLVNMGMRPGIPDPLGIERLGRHLRRLRPAIVQTWMDHSNLIAGLAARMAPRTKVVWGVHHSHHVAGLTKRSTLMTVSACAMLSRRLPDRIVYCSEHSRHMYEQDGFAEERGVVIPNGFDTDRFRPDDAARKAIRREIGVNENTILIGLVARYDPLKDHETFLRAAAILAETHSDVHFLLCGANVNRNNIELLGRIKSLRINERHVHLLGPRHDVPRVNAAIDVMTSSSISEAFPLVVGEAMSCGVPCVVTDVGDSSLIVGETGIVIPPRDPRAMASAWRKMLAMEPMVRRRLGMQARARVRERFDLDAVTRRYESLYENMLSQPTAFRASGERAIEHNIQRMELSHGR